MAQLNFNANDHEPRDSFDLLPNGWQPAEATASEMKDTKAGDGAYLQIEWTITAGEFQGRKLWSRLNLKNRNSTAVEIAQRDLSAICRATGIMEVNDSSQLHGKPIQVKVKTRPAKGEFDASNEIAGYKPLDAPGASTSTAAPASGGGSSSAPWGRR